MLNRLTKNYSKTLLVVFIISGISPVIARTLPDVKLDSWISIVSYGFSILATVAATVLSFFTNTEAPEPTPPKVP